MWIALAYALGYLGWTRVGGASAAAPGIASEGVYLPLLAGSITLLLLAARRGGAHNSLRHTLYLLAAASAAIAAGNLLVLAQLLRVGSVAVASPIDFCFLASYPLAFAALLLVPGDRRPADLWKMVCDAGMVLSGTGVALWYFVLRTTLPASANPIAVALALIYPLGDLLLLVALVTIVLRQPASAHRIALRWLALGSAQMVFANLLFNLMVARTGQRGSPAIAALYLGYFVAQVAAAERFWRGPLSDAAAPSELSQRVSRALRILLPFIASGATYLLLLASALHHRSAPLSGLTLGALAVSLFIGVRQLFAFRSTTEVLAGQMLQASEARFRSLVQHSSDLVFQLDVNGVVTFANSSAARVLDHGAEALIGRRMVELAYDADAARIAAFIQTVSALPGVSPTAEWRLRREDGNVVHVEVSASNLLADPTVRGIVLHARDIGERKELLDQLAYQAFHDPLTGLANRALFYDRVGHALTLAQRQERTVMVLFLDLDDFKQVNDNLGHAEGDRLLSMIAARLRACARATDTVARLGGDEFALLVEDHQLDEGGSHLIGRIREQMSFPFTLAGTELRMTSSIGSATGRGGSVDDILRHADIAMYEAKRNEKGSHRAYEAGRSLPA